MNNNLKTVKTVKVLYIRANFAARKLQRHWFCDFEKLNIFNDFLNVLGLFVDRLPFFKKILATTRKVLFSIWIFLFLFRLVIFWSRKNSITLRLFWTILSGGKRILFIFLIFGIVSIFFWNFRISGIEKFLKNKQLTCFSIKHY
jgi:hypothetical protein